MKSRLEGTPTSPLGDPAMIRVRRILYPTDFSPHSTAAYFHALSLAEAHGALLIVAHVAREGDDRAKLTDQLREIRPSDPNLVTDHVLLDGPPAEAITGYANRAGVDMIVMGTRHSAPCCASSIGSVAERVLREAHCAVLVAKMPRHAVR